LLADSKPDQVENGLVIEGLDVNEGILNCGSKELFLKLLVDYYKLIDSKSALVESYLEEGLLREYTIEVHALKSTARMIGAMELSKKFYRLEQLGNDGNEKALALETPAVLSLYRSYKPILEPFALANQQEKAQVSKEEMIAELENLKIAMDTFDLDGADEAMHKLEGFMFDEKLQVKIDQLSALVTDIAMEDVIHLAEELINELKK